MVNGIPFTTVNELPAPSKFSDSKVLVPAVTTRLLVLPKHMADGVAVIDEIEVNAFIVSVFVDVAAAQLPLPFAVKVNITLPAAISAALGV